MTLHFTQDATHRITAHSGSIIVGAVFPPIGERQHRLPWAWRLWVNGSTIATEGGAKTEAAARAALRVAWQDFIARAGLKEATE